MDVGELIAKLSSIKKKVGKDVKVVYMYGENVECHLAQLVHISLVYTNHDVNMLVNGYTMTELDNDKFITAKEYKSLKDKSGYNPIVLVTDKIK